MVSVSPAARKSKVLSAALKLKPTEPVPVLSVVTVVESAVASVLTSPLGSVVPPDQVSLASVLVAVWWLVRSTSVKLGVPGGGAGVLLPGGAGGWGMVGGPG